MKKVFYCLLAVGFMMLSCKKNSTPPPSPPIISFASFTTTDGNIAKFTFNFTDADGDIGLQQVDQDSSNYDFYMRYYYKNYLGQYVPFYYHASGQPANPLTDSTIYVYHIPYVTDNIKSKMLSGQIIIDLNGYKPYSSDSTNNLRYTFWIYDRARHESNVVTTPGFQTPN
jgi:hypothetical protein